MSLFLPGPLLLLAIASQKNAGRVHAVNTAKVKVEDEPKALPHSVEIVEAPKKPIRKQALPTSTQKASMLSDMLYYMGNPAASRMSSVVKAMSVLQQPEPRVQLPMTPNQRTMGLLKVMTQMAGVPSGPLGAMNLLSQTGQMGNIMSMLNKKSPGVNALPANIMDNINKVLSGMDPAKKDELISMAKQIISKS